METVTDYVDIRVQQLGDIAIYYVQRTGDQAGIHRLSLTPAGAEMPELNKSLVFLKEEAIYLLMAYDVIDKPFRPKDSRVWCAFLNLDIFWQLECEGKYRRLMEVPR